MKASIKPPEKRRGNFKLIQIYNQYEKELREVPIPYLSIRLHLADFDNHKEHTGKDIDQVRICTIVPEKIYPKEMETGVGGCQFVANFASVPVRDPDL